MSAVRGAFTCGKKKRRKKNKTVSAPKTALLLGYIILFKAVDKSRQNTSQFRVKESQKGTSRCIVIFTHI